MTGRIDFRYDPVRDIVFAMPHWQIETLDDVRNWYLQYADYFEANFQGRKVDLVLDLADFRIGASIARLWGEYRARMNNTYTRHSYRVSSDPRVALYVKTSGVRYDASTYEAPTEEDAVEGVMAARRSGGS